MFYARKGEDKWIDRGEVANWDFNVGDFTIDGANHNLDLSGVIPSNAKEVILHVVMSCNTASRYCTLTQKGFTYSRNGVSRKSQVGGVSRAFDARLMVGTDGVIQYNVQSATWPVFSMAVRKWRV